MRLSFFEKKNQRQIKPKYTGGFTLIELLVTISIFVILTGVVLYNENSFDNTILLSDLAYDTALTVRQAQAYGVNTQEIPGSGFASSTGVYFNTNTTAAGSNTNFVLFADTNGDGLYDSVSKQPGLVTSCPVGSTECLQKYSIKNGNTITAMCVGTSAQDCAQTPVSNLTILFTRPDPDANIFTINSGGSKSSPYGYAQITVSSGGNASSRNIVVTATGQIYVQ